MVFVDKCYFMSVWFDVFSDAERHLIVSLSNKKMWQDEIIIRLATLYICVCNV